MDSKERMDNAVPSCIAQWLLAPYLEFSLRYGGKKKILLDCACGNAYQRTFLDDRFEIVHYVDKNPPLPGYNWHAVDLETEKLPFKNKTFDVVFSFETIEHLDENHQVAFVEELMRVGKTVIIGSVSADGPNYIGNDLIFKNGMNPYHKREFKADEWKDFFYKYSLEVFKSKRIYIYSLPEFYHLVVTDAGLEIKDGIDPKNGISNYVVLT